MIQYKLLSIADAVEQKLDTGYRNFDPDWDFGSILYRVEDGVYYFVGSDMMEPEDAKFSRDLGFLFEELGKLAKQINEMK